MTRALAPYGRVLASYTGHGRLRLQTGEPLRCSFSACQLADGEIILLAQAHRGSMAWPPGPLLSFEGTTRHGEQLVSDGQGCWVTDLRPPSATVGFSLAFQLPALTVRARARETGPLVEARFGVTNFVCRENMRAPLTLRASAGTTEIELVAVPDAERVVRRIRTLRSIDVTCELRVPLRDGVALEAVSDQAHTLCQALSIANGSRVEWVNCDLYDAAGQRVERRHRNHVTKRYAGWPIIDFRNGWTPDARRFTEEAFRVLATGAEPLLRPSIIESCLDAKAQEDFLESRGAKVAISLEMLRWTLASTEGRREPGALLEWPAFERLAPELRGAMATVLDAHGVAPHTSASRVCARSLRRLNQAGAEGGQFGRMLHQLNERIGLRADRETIERVTRSRHALVHEGKFYHQLAPDSRPASLPPLASAADEYYFLIGFLDRVLLALLRYQGPYLDWGVPAGHQPRSAHFP